jgi:T5SS/PEP-CTERM-associated repeat protein
VSHQFAFIGHDEDEVDMDDLEATAVVTAGGVWNTAGTLNVGDVHRGVLNITNGGTVTTTIPQIPVGSTIGSNGGVGHVTVDGAASSWTNTICGINVGGFGGEGTLDVKNGADVSSGEGFVARGEGSVGTANIDGAGSTWTCDSFLVLGLEGDGTMNVTNGGAVSSLWGLVGAQFPEGRGEVNVGNGSSWTMAEHLRISIGAPGTLTIRGTGIVSAPEGTDIGVNGRLQGSGTIDSQVSNEGVIAPGESIGTLTITDGLFQYDGSRLEMEIASATSFDKLLVSEYAVLDGVLDVRLLGSYVPAPTATFTLLTTSDREEMFDQVTVTRNNLPAGSFSVSYTATSVILSNFQSTGFLAADFDEDHAVDGDDLARWRTNFGRVSAATHGQGDADFDGDVDGNDFLIWQRQLGGTSVVPASVPVPEPTTLPLVVMGALAIYRRQRRTV